MSASHRCSLIWAEAKALTQFQWTQWKCENNLPIIYGIKACAILWNLNGYPRSGSGSNKSTAVQTLNPAVLSHMSALNANMTSLLFEGAEHN